MSIDKKYTVLGERLTTEEACTKYKCSYARFRFLVTNNKLHLIAKGNTPRKRKKFLCNGEMLDKQQLMKKYDVCETRINYLISIGELDRITKPYYKKSSKKKYLVKGEMIRAHEACEKYGIDLGRFFSLLKHDRMEYIDKPKRTYSKLKKWECHGEMLTMKEMCKKYDSSQNRVRYLIDTDQLWRIEFKGHYPTSVKSRGIVYSSYEECAKHNNCRKQHVGAMIALGRIDYIGRNSNPNFKQEWTAWQAMLENERFERKNAELLKQANKLKPCWEKRAMEKIDD